MKTISDFPTLETCVGTHLTLQQTEEVGKRVIPDEWVSRFEKAETALVEMEDTMLSDHVDQDLLEDRFKDVCEPSDDTLEVFIDGDESVVDQICASIDNALTALEVIKALREGELVAMMQV